MNTGVLPLVQLVFPMVLQLERHTHILTAIPVGLAICDVHANHTGTFGLQPLIEFVHVASQLRQHFLYAHLLHHLYRSLAVVYYCSYMSYLPIWEQIKSLHLF